MKIYRRKLRKSSAGLHRPTLCLENVEAAAAFGRLIGYKGPWVAAGDGTKVRPLLNCTNAFVDSGEHGAHIIGSCLDLSETFFSTAEEQDAVVKKIASTKQCVAKQAWALGLKV
jgi:hypothetical protein